MEKTRSPLDSEALYELALAAGGSLDPAAICRECVGILVGRGAGARAAVWSNRMALAPTPSLLAAQTPYYTLACAPERPPATLEAAPGLEARLAAGVGFVAPADHPDLAGLTAAGAGGEVVVLPLGDEGFLELAPAAGLPAPAALAALAPVARRLGVGLEGCRHRLALEAGAERLQRLLHEVKTPLTAVRGFAELLVNREVAAERRRELLGMLHAEALRLGETLDRASQAAPGEERYRAAERMRLASRLEAVGQLAGGIAHDFNNLLTAISGYSELLLGRLGPDEPMRAELTEIHRAGERAADLTRQLLAFSRIQVLEPRRLDLNVEVREAASMLRRLIGEAVALVLDLDPALGTVEADPGQLHQVILNLAVNARDAMPGGGTLTLATDEVAFDQPDRSHPEVAMPAARYVRLRVADTGTGMDEQTRARIFEPFFTTKEAGKGTGLGLSTVYGIVKQSGGFIWAASEPGAGTTFEIYLPWVAGEAEAPAERDAAPAAEPVTASVLVAEDNPAVRALIREILGSGGYTVHLAADGAAALAVVARGEPLDLVISDVVMPDLLGPELERRTAALRPGLRFLFISGYTGETVERPGALGPGAPFLEKPFGAAKLLAKVREVLASPPPPPPAHPTG